MNNLPVLFNWDNIDNCDLETQMHHYQHQIEKCGIFLKGFDSTIEEIKNFASKDYEVQDLSMELTKIQIQIDLAREQLSLQANSSESDENGSDEDKFNDEDKVTLACEKKRRSRLKKRIAKLLHPDKTGSNFNSAMYDHAMQLLDTFQYTELEALLDDLEKSKSNTASKFSKKQARERLEHVVNNLKLRFSYLMSEIEDKIRSSDGTLFDIYQKQGRLCYQHIVIIRNIQYQNISEAKTELMILRQRLKNLKNDADEFTVI
jgi:hypothetical protein